MKFNSIAVPEAWHLKKILMVLKLTTCILFIALLQVSAAGYGQVSLNESNVPLEKVLKLINKQTGYHFFYDSEDLDKKVVSVNVKNVTVETALKTCLDNLPLTYKIVGRNIVLKQLEQSVPMSPAVSNVATQVTVGGKVTDETGGPMSGVGIMNKRSKKVAVTDKDGSYAIAAERADVLVFSYIGYKTTDVTVGNSTVYNVKLEPVTSGLEQVVVVGYGTVKRKDLTGSVASVSVDEIKDIPFMSVDQALSGKAAGVQVVQGDGSPGGVASIRVRGGTSIMGGNDPLYIIDGVQITPQNRYISTPGELVDPVARASSDSSPALAGAFARGLNSLAGLNINDIETIDILKDASGTAIYGSKAANGVVIITTKKGRRDQKPVVELNNYTGFSNPIKAELLNADEYRTIMKEAAQNLLNEQAALGEPLSARASSIVNTPDFLGADNTDWLDLVLRTGLTQNTDLSVRGGGKASRYYTSLSYSKQSGVIEGTDFSRLSGKVNFDNEVTSKFKVITNINYGFTTNNITNGAYSQALYAPPTRSPYNADGSLTNLSAGAIGSDAYLGLQNPLLLLKGINRGKNAMFLGSLTLEYDILKNLKFRSQSSVNYNNYQQRNFTPSSTLVASGSTNAVDSKGGVGSLGQSENVSYLYENTLNYNTQFAEHRLDFVAGTSWQLSKSSSFQASGQTFPDDVVLNHLGSAAVTLPNVSSFGQNSLLSFYARGNYAYQDKYLLTVTARSDASSKFSNTNRIGYFPSAGVAWRLSEENFMKDISWIDDIKLRASAGYTGTQNIGDYLYRTLYTPATYNGANAVIPSQLGNNAIKWESTLQKDAGIDLSLFDSRLSASIGLYEKKSSGLLFTLPLAPSSSFSNLTANLADIRNRGLEIGLQGEILRAKSFTWRSDLNVSFNRSLVTGLNMDYADPKHGSVNSNNGQSYIMSNTVLRTGMAVGQFVGAQYAGIIQNTEQLEAYKAQQPFYMFFNPYLNIGDAMYQIGSGPLEGFVDTYRLIGSAAPKFYGGWTNTLIFSNFSLVSLLNYSYGGQILYLADIRDNFIYDMANKGRVVLGRWTPENTNTDRPRLVYGQNSIGTTSSSIYSSSYIKLKSLTLNYQLPQTLLQRLKVANLSVYVSGTNLFTISKYPGQDPEVSNDPYSLVDGYTDSNAYPTIRQYVLGARLSF